MITEVFTVDETYEGCRIDKYLSDLFSDRSRAFIQKLISSENVTVFGNVVKKSHVLHIYDEVSITIPEAEALCLTPENIPLDILYEDDFILVVNKPKGMVVHPGAGNTEHTLVNAVLYHCGDSLSGINGVMRPGIVHRIDKDTTGSVIICKNDIAHESISKQLFEHTCDRVYLGICDGNIKTDNGTIEGYIGRDHKNRLRMTLSDDPGCGKYSKTHYQVLEHFRDFSYVSFKLETGRTHQIRAHMAHINHPLTGDILYGCKKTPFGTTGQCLHAAHIAFTHPDSGERIELDAPLPEYFTNILDRLRT